MNQMSKTRTSAVLLKHGKKVLSSEYKADSAKSDDRTAHTSGSC